MVEQEQSGELTDVARAALPRWGIAPEAIVTLISLSENGMFLVTAGADRWIMRVHRKGYHTLAGVRSELAWMHALRSDAGVETPQAVKGCDGEYLQLVTALPGREPRMVVVFEFIAGTEPQPDDLRAAFRQLGAISAQMHRHARGWQRPAWFERQVWDYDGALGEKPNWGPWRAGFAPQFAGIEIVTRADAEMRKRLHRFGKDSSRFGLIHSDLRLANLLVDNGVTKVLDFDDSGLGWYLYDVASSVTFLETRPDVDDIVAAWIEGYRTREVLTVEEIAEISTMMMFRRLIIMGWAGSHPNTDLARWMGDQYTVDTVTFADAYLSTIAR